MVTAPHLGGHFGETIMDRDTFDYLLGRYHPATMIDVGCGPGGMVTYARSKGLEATGIDGDPGVNADVCHDYTTGPLVVPAHDLVWCVEFVEHVEAEYLPNYLATFNAGKVLLLTHAQPDQPGYHHVNCQPDNYWLAALAPYWQIDYETTGWVRVHSTEPFLKANALVFVR